MSSLLQPSAAQVAKQPGPPRGVRFAAWLQLSHAQELATPDHLKLLTTPNAGM
ncbi:MAG: hypothetical protein IH899_05880 [Planctomycetes bacterium]|nr:hypothetical protein [Planctomycetota bacterium]